MRSMFRSVILTAAWLMVIYGVGSTSAQNLFVADFGSNILEFTPGGSQSTFATGLSQANSLVFDSSGNLFLSDSGDYVIYKYTPDGTPSVFATGISLPNAMA